MVKRIDTDEVYKKQSDGSMIVVQSTQVEREIEIDSDAELAAAIEAATTLQELKDALLGRVRPGKAAAKSV